MINNNCPQPPSATISYVDGEEQILEFPVKSGSMTNIKIDGQKIMEIHDLTKTVKSFCYLVSSAVVVVIALEIYLILK